MKTNIMDYSLLLGVYRLRWWRRRRPPTTTRARRRRRRGRRRGLPHHHPHAFARNGRQRDRPLQEWDVGKRLERWAKVALCCLWSDRQGMSAVEPDHYSRRFLRMIDRLIVRGLLAS